MKINKIILLLLSLWIFHVIANLIYLKIDTTPPIWDPACHSLQSIKIFDIINSPDLTFKNDLKAEIVGCTRIYPPLVYLIIYPFYKIFGTTTDVAVGVISLVFYLILILSVYKIGELVSKKQWVGLLAAFLVTMYPFIYSSSKQFLLDLPLTAIVSLSIYLLLKSDNFKDRKYSVLFGIVLGIGFLVKEACIIFIVGPLSVALINEPHARVDKIKRYKNVFFSLIGTVCIVFIWYAHEFNAIHAYAKDFLFYKRTFFEDDPVWYEFDGLIYYIKGLILQQTSFFYFIIFIISLVIIFRKMNDSKKILLSWFFVSLLVLTLLKTKDYRWSMPILPAVAIISALGIKSISKRLLRRLLIFILMIYSALQFTLQSLGNYYDTVPSRFPMSGVINTYLRGYVKYGWVPYPKKDSYDIDKIFNIIFKEEKNKNEIRSVYLIASDGLFNEYTLRYLARQKGHYVYFTALIFFQSPLQELEKASKGSFIIHVYPEKGGFSCNSNLLMRYFLENAGAYVLLYTDDYGFDRKMYVYRKS